MPRPRVALAAITAFALTTAAACGGSQEPAAQGGPAKPVVVTSTNVWAAVVSAVAGDKAEVRAILTDPSADPHGYEAKPADALAFKDADIALSNGGGYDDFFTALADTNAADARRVVAVDLVDDHGHDDAAGGSGTAAPTTTDPAAAPTAPTTTEDHAHEDGHEHEGEAGHGSEAAAPTTTESAADGHDDHGHEGHDHSQNEHVWYDLHVVAHVADKVAEELSAVDSANAAVYTANAGSFTKGIEDLETKVAAIGTAKPGLKVVSTEPVAEFLLEAAGMTDVTPEAFAKAVEDENDPPVEARAATEQLISGKQVAVVVYNEQTSTPITEALKKTAQDAGVPVVGVTETLPEGATDYLGWMTQQVEALSKAATG